MFTRKGLVSGVAGYLQCVLNAVWEVLEGAQWDGSIRTRRALFIGLSQVRHHHQSVTSAPLRAPFQHRPLVFDATSVKKDPWTAN